MMRKRTAWLLPLFVMGGIFYLSHIPGGSFPPLFPMADKVVHGVLYAGLGIALMRALHYSWGGFSVLMGCAGLLVALIYGVTDEWHQWYIPGRSTEFADLVADGIGAVIGILCYVAYHWYRAGHGRLPRTAASH